MPHDEIEHKNPIKIKIYRPEDGDHDSQWERAGFKKGEIESRVNDVVLFRNDHLPNCYKMIVDVTYELPKKDKAAQLGIVNKHGLVIRVNYASPFKGSILPGDVILLVNNINVYFDDKTIMEKLEDKTQGSKTKNVEKKAPAPGTQDFKTVVSKILGSKSETKITITVARLKNRVGTFKCPAGITSTPGYSMDMALLYQYKHLKLGLNMMQTGTKCVVNYTVPETVAHLSLNIGEAILAVDDCATTSLEDVRQKILDGINKNGWCRLIVEYPMTDPMRNMVRGQLTTASKAMERPPYAVCGDVKKYCEEGIEALKNGKELEPALKKEKEKEKENTKDSDRKELEKKKSTRRTNKKETLVEFRKTTDEFGIPSEWNSKLFVVLPPLKTKESESTENSQINKK